MSSNIEDICVVVVLFCPTKAQIQTFEMLSRDICVICVDNSSFTNNLNLQYYYPQYKNVGIARAQNIGIETASRIGANYIIFFDQDSHVNIDFIKKMKVEYMCIQKTDPSFGVLGPLIIEEKTNKEYKNTSDINASYSKVTDVISSGMFFSTDTARLIGPLDNTLFIDYVDCEWCWRAKCKGISTYMTRQVCLPHTVGKRVFVVFGIHFGVSAAFRYYFQFRNAIWLIKRSYPPKAWKIKALIRILLDFFVIPVVSKEHCCVLKNMLIGLKDGFKQNKDE